MAEKVPCGSVNKEDSECQFLRTHIPTAADDAEDIKKQENLIRAENIAARARNARTRKLAPTQQGDFEGNSTVKRIVPNTPNPPEIIPNAQTTPGGYDPCAVAVEEAKRQMLEYCATLP